MAPPKHYSAKDLEKLNSTANTTPLHSAVYDNDIDKVQLLLRNGEDINALNKLGFSPLHRAIFSGLETIVESFINSGAIVYCNKKFINQLLLFFLTDRPKVRICLPTLMKQLIRQKALKLLDDELYFMCEKVIINQSEELKNWKVVCQAECDQMSREFICSTHNITFSHLLTKKLHEVAENLNVKEIHEKLSRVNLDAKFPQYSRMLKKRIEVAENLAKQLNEAYQTLQYIFPYKKLPDTFVIQTLRSLDEKDIQNLVVLNA